MLWSDSNHNWNGLANLRKISETAVECSRVDQWAEEQAQSDRRILAASLTQKDAVELWNQQNRFRMPLQSCQQNGRHPVWGTHVGSDIYRGWTIRQQIEKPRIFEIPNYMFPQTALTGWDL
jgi:hypothetical protein